MLPRCRPVFSYAYEGTDGGFFQIECKGTKNIWNSVLRLRNEGQETGKEYKQKAFHRNMSFHFGYKGTKKLANMQILFTKIIKNSLLFAKICIYTKKVVTLSAFLKIITNKIEEL